MIIGAHSIIFSKKPEADRAFLRDILGLPHVDVGDGWLIFGLPPAEVAVHPSHKNDVHEFYLLCADIERFVASMEKRGIRCGRVESMPWGKLTRLALPGGGKLGVYEPRHARPKSMAARRAKPPARKLNPKSASVHGAKPAAGRRSVRTPATKKAPRGRS